MKDRVITIDGKKYKYVGTRDTRGQADSYAQGLRCDGELVRVRKEHGGYSIWARSGRKLLPYDITRRGAMTIRYTQHGEPFKARKLSGMTFSRTLTATTKAEAQERARYYRGKGALVRVVPAKSHDGNIYEVYTR